MSNRLRLDAALIVAHGTDAALRRDDRIRLNVGVDVRLRRDRTSGSQDVAERARETAVPVDARIGAQSRGRGIVRIGVVILGSAVALRIIASLFNRVGNLPVATSFRTRRATARGVVASADIVAADCARIARRLRRSRRAAAIRINSFRKSAGNPTERRGRNTRDVVDKRIETAAGVPVTGAVGAIGAASGLTRNVARRGV